MGLAFTKKEGETFRVGEATITVVRVETGKRVRFNVSAPEHIKIRREEASNDSN